MNFEKRIKKLEENNQKIINSSFRQLHGLVEDRDEYLIGTENMSSIQFALWKIYKCVGIEYKDIPVDIKDEEEQLNYEIEATHTMTRKVNLTGEWYKNMAEPVLCRLNNEQYIAVEPNFWGKCSYYDVKAKSYIKINAKNVNQISDEGIVFYWSLPDKVNSSKEFLKVVLGKISKNDVYMILLVSFWIAVLGLILPYVNKFVFDKIIPTGNVNDILPIAALISGALVSAVFFKIVRATAIVSTVHRLSNALQNAMFVKVLSLPVNFFKEHQAGELVNRILTAGNIAYYLSENSITALFEFLFIGVQIFQIYIFAPQLVYLSVLTVIIVLLFGILETWAKINQNRKYLQNSASLDGLVFEMFSGITQVRMTASEMRFFKRWLTAYEKESDDKYNPSPIIKYAGSVYEFIMLASIIVIYVISVSKGINSSDFIGFTSAYGMLTYAAVNIRDAFEAFADFKVSVDMIKPLITENSESKKVKKSCPHLKGEIELNNLSFRYSADDRYVIDNLNLNIKPNEYVAIVGTSGCGKSTLIRLMLGFENPTLGAVYYDGEDIADLEVKNLRNQIGTVLQNGRLLSGDLYSNITVASQDICLDDVWEATEIAGIKKDIEEMPMGLNTIVSESSGGLSGGQKQRILIARAVVRKPKIIIFDEATSALDNITQSHITDALNKFDATRIVVAHRLSTIKDCDRIIVMDKGSIAAEGTYAELSSKDGLFKNMIERQLI